MSDDVICKPEPMPATVDDAVVLVLREDPTRESRELAKLKGGAAVEIIGHQVNEWARIRAGNLDGWAIAQYIHAK